MKQELRASAGTTLATFEQSQTGSVETSGWDQRKSSETQSFGAARQVLQCNRFVKSIQAGVFTMSLLVAILAVNAIVHGIVVTRFGVQNNNQPFLVFAIVYAALAIAVYLSVPYALWAVLLLATVGILGLTVTFNKPVRDKTLDKLIWVLDAITIVTAVYLLSVA